MSKKERNELVEKEKELIKKIIVSRINNDGYDDLYVEGLRQIIEQNNEVITDFFTSKEGKEYIDSVLAEEKEHKGLEDITTTIDSKEPTNDISSNSFYKLFCDYIAISDSTKSWNEDYDNGEHYNINEEFNTKFKSLTFINDYFLGKRLLEVTDWFFNTFGDVHHDKEGFAALVSNDSERAFALRNELTGNGLELTLDSEDLEVDITSYYLLSMLKMKLCHDFTMANNKLIKDLYESEEREEVTSGTTLFLLLNTTAYISLAKEYGFIPDQLSIEPLVKQTKNVLNYFPRSIGYEEAMGELDHLIDNADNLAESYLMNNQYKL